MTRTLGTLLFVAIVGACARPSAVQPPRVIINSGGPLITAESCPSQRPTSWPRSQFRAFLGSPDVTLETQTGTLLFAVRVDSLPGPQSAQISVRNQTVRLDMPYGDSVIRVSAPAGRYYFHARRTGAQTLQDSIDVRSGFVDTVRIFLGREIFCSQR